jgi:hypothetical protein
LREPIPIDFPLVSCDRFLLQHRQIYDRYLLALRASFVRIDNPTDPGKADQTRATGVDVEKPMPRRPAKVTQADIARAIRAAKEAGASAVTIDSDGVIRIALTATPPTKPANDCGEIWVPSQALKSFLKRTESG